MRRPASFALLLLLAGATIYLQGTAWAAQTQPAALASSTTWSAQTAITTYLDTPDGAFGPVVEIAPNGTELTVAYIRGIDTSTVLNPYFRRSSDNGITWLPAAPIHLSSPNAKSLHLDFTYDGSGVTHAVWREGDGGNLVYKPGGTWNSVTLPVVISDPPPQSLSGANNPQIAASGSSTLDVVWSEDAGGSPNILHSRSLNGGNSWSVPMAVVSTPPRSSNPALAIGQNGSLHVVWEEGTIPSKTIYYAQGIPGSGSNITWSSGIELTTKGADDARHPEITVDGAALHVSFTKLQGKDQQMETARHLACSSQCTTAGNWHEQPTSEQFVGIDVLNPNDSIVTDIAYGNGCSYIFYDGTTSDYPDNKNIIWGISSCDLNRDKITNHQIQSNNPNLAIHGQWLHLTFEQKTNPIDPLWADIYYVRGRLPSFIFLPTVLR